MKDRAYQVEWKEQGNWEQDDDWQYCTMDIPVGSPPRQAGFPLDADRCRGGESRGEHRYKWKEGSRLIGQIRSKENRSHAVTEEVYGVCQFG